MRPEDMRGAAALLTILLLFMLSIAPLLVGFGQELELVVRVVDREGQPRSNVDVLVVNSTDTFRFRSDESGNAYFKLLSPGTYALKAVMDGIEVATKEITFPDVTETELVLNIGDLRVKVIDANGNPVPKLNVTLTSSSKKVIKSSLSDDVGNINIADLPYSNLSDVGNYEVVMLLENVIVANQTFRFPEELTNFTVDVVRLNLTLLNIEGDPLPVAKVYLSSEGYSTSAFVNDGGGSLWPIPSSKRVGEYSLEITVKYPGGENEVTVYKESIELDSYVSKQLILDLATLTVNVTDDAGTPLRGLSLILNSDKAGNFSVATTGSDGVARFFDIPLSTGRFSLGEYRIYVMKGDVKLAESRTTFIKPDFVHRIHIERKPTIITLKKEDGTPLVGAIVELFDEVTGIKINSTSGSDGKAELLALPGLHSYGVRFKGVKVASGEVELTGEPIELIVKGLDIPLTLKVVDWFGGLVSNAKVKVYQGDEELKVKRIGGAKYTTTVPVSGAVRVDVFFNGELVERRMLEVSGPTTLTISIRGLVVGSNIISVETVFTAIAAAFLTFSAAMVALLFVKKRVRAT